MVRTLAERRVSHRPSEMKPKRSFVLVLFGVGLTREHVHAIREAAAHAVRVEHTHTHRVSHTKKSTALESIPHSSNIRL